MDEELRRILQAHGGLSTSIDRLGEEADLYAAGLNSLATVNVMLAIEHRFSIEIPDDLLTRRTFQTLSALRRTVSKLQAEMVAQ